MDLQTLEKMTVLKLREEALHIPGLTGVRGMNKEELIRAIATSKGISLTGRARGGAGRSDLKRQIRELKDEIAKALEAKNRDQLKKLRRQVKRLKRQTRRFQAEPPTQEAPTQAPSA